MGIGIRAMSLLLGAGAIVIAQPRAGCPQGQYPDRRPDARMRLKARDAGVVLRHGNGPGQCDIYGARDVWVYESDGTYYMHYDAAGPQGWLCSLAISDNLTSWTTRGPILALGAPGDDDSASASYGVTFRQGDKWHMFYLGTPNVTPPPDRIPSFPYLTMKAEGSSAAGPWRKRKDITPFRPAPATYYSATASPGHIVRFGDEYLQLFSASTQTTAGIKRTIGLARTRDLDGTWSIALEPLLPLEEQIENTSLYYEPACSTWFMFTNHVGIGSDGAEYTDAVWVYWSKNLVHWQAKDKAVVLDGSNCTWSHRCIGLPSVVKVGRRLALFYDAPGGNSISHMRRDIGLAWMDLPLKPPR